MNYLYEVTDRLIWHEFSLAFSYSKGIRIYIDNRRKLNRLTNCILTILSTSSAITYWANPFYGAILSSLTAFAIIVKQLAPIFMQPEIELNKLHEAADFFSRYQSDMEKMYVALKYNNLHPTFLQEEFFKLKLQSAKYITITNEYYRGLPNNKERLIKIELEKYVKELFP